MLKPDAFKRGLIGTIIGRIEAKGYRILEAKTVNLTESVLKEHYAHVADQPFFPELVAYMTSGPVLAMIIEGNNCIDGMRILMGATKAEEASAGTIRGDFANNTGENLIHGSDSAEAAKTEIARFFGR